MINKSNLKREWNKPEIESLELSNTMNNGLNNGNGNGNGFGHCNHGGVPGIGVGHDKYDYGMCS